MGQNTKKISIIVPVYNVEQYLQPCIDSLIEQTVDDYEVIFVNDASQDRSLAILRENEAKYPNVIRVIDCKENKRQGAARNIGIRAACGEYIGFVDSDDFVRPNMYEKLYEKACTGVDAVFGRYIEVADKCDEKMLRHNKDEGRKRPEWSKEILALEGKTLCEADVQELIAGSTGGVWCALWKKSIILENDVWFPERLKYEDNYWASLIRCYLKRIAFASDATYYYRIRQTSTTRKRNAQDHYDRITVDKMLMETVDARNLYSKYKEAWDYLHIFRLCFTTFYHFHEHLDDPDYETLKGLIRDMKQKCPKWRKNRYLIRETSWKYRVLCTGITSAPKVMGRLLGCLGFW